MMKLDRMDIKILQALQNEGRLTNQSLAQRVALSPSACLARVRRLEAAGIISGYHAHVDIELVRSTLIILAEISLKRHNSTEFARFERMINTMPEKSVDLRDRNSTRLNSSHQIISYDLFFLQKT